MREHGVSMVRISHYHFEGCNLRELGSLAVVQLSRCWRLDRVTMSHRIVGKVDLDLICDLKPCLCARELDKLQP